MKSKYKTIHLTLSSENFGILKQYANDTLGLKVTEYVRSIINQKAKSISNKSKEVENDDNTNS